MGDEGEAEKVVKAPEQGGGADKPDMFRKAAEEREDRQAEAGPEPSENGDKIEGETDVGASEVQPSTSGETAGASKEPSSVEETTSEPVEVTGKTEVKVEGGEEGDEESGVEEVKGEQEGDAEAKRIYEDPNKDPEYKKAVAEAQKRAVDAGASLGDEKYEGEMWKSLSDFAKKYPEKAKAYAKSDEDLGGIVKVQELVKRIDKGELDIGNPEFWKVLGEFGGVESEELRGVVEEKLKEIGLPELNELGEDFDFSKLDLDGIKAFIESVEDPDLKEFFEEGFKEIEEKVKEVRGVDEEVVEEVGSEEEAEEGEGVESEVSAEHIKAKAQWAYNQGKDYRRYRIDKSEAPALAEMFKAELTAREESGEPILQKEKKGKLQKVAGLFDYVVPSKADCESFVGELKLTDQDREKVMNEVGRMITIQWIKNLAKYAAAETLSEMNDQFKKLKNEMAKNMKQALAEGAQQQA